MPGSNNQPDKKISGIEKLPEATRKKILIGSVALITFILLVAWITNFSHSIQSVTSEKSSSEFTEILEKTKQGVEQISAEVGKIKEATKILQDIPTTTPTTEISEANIDKLKEKILEQQANQPATTTKEMPEQP